MGEMEAVLVRRSARETTAELLGAAGARRLRCGRRRRPGNGKWAWDVSGRRWRGYWLASACLGRGGQGAGDARPSPRTRGARALPVSATDAVIQFAQTTRSRA